ncbi:putative MPP superfamily phosphohydrolase [Kribbella voronezhensis]|uniref:Putative MPP superfamily phosphohydrolase n=1 Tax=Kribbella voronezhensis TaxID=2512212 RepID=A0A4R7TBG2_9ACTN|nr:metallophosphoesterase [Kribbella voronezhensis]TDU89402.1 putative MPP superfamily phosphohydrolase [Kribbella voronezhensis]
MSFTGLAARTLKTTAVVAGVGAACVAYAAGVEVRWYTLRRFTVPVLPAGSDPVKVLHLSDLHLMPNQERKIRWVNELAQLEPDLVVNTGDNLSSPHSVLPLLRAHGALLDLPGVFVFGSNDYWKPHFKNPVNYLLPAQKQRHKPHGPNLPFEEMRKAFTDAGWADLNNAKTTLKVNGLRLDFAGTDDPHIKRDRYAEVAGEVDPTADLSIGVTHAPYQRVLNGFVGDGYPLVLAGHTHGGQLAVPIYGALVTNCDLDTSRVKGLTSWGHNGRQAALHVSAGLGTSPYAPVRFACRPEATLLTLVPRINPISSQR